MDLTEVLKLNAKGALLKLYVQPGSSKNEVVGLFGDGPRLKIKVKAQPQDGEANDEVRSFVGRLFGISKSRVEILRGESSRQKDLLLDLPFEDAIISLKEILKLN